VSRFRLVPLVAAAGALLALTGCTSSGAGQKAAGTPVVSAPSTPSAPETTPSAPPPSSSSATAAPSTPVASTTTPPHRSQAPLTTVPAPSHSTAPPAERSTCTHVTVRVIPGGAEQGSEFAALQFTNEGTQGCELVGYPGVTLFRNGKQIGKPSEPKTTARSRRQLAPGATAESDLFSYTQNCQAPLSDTVRVVIPGTALATQRPHFVMRACLLRVDALGAPE
jgi:hypothetical protein